MTPRGRNERRRKALTDPIRVQPIRRCKVVYHVPVHTPSDLSKERTTTGEPLKLPNNDLSSVPRRQRAPQRKTASKLDSAKISTLPSPPPLHNKPSKRIISMSQAAESKDEMRKSIPPTRQASKRGKVTHLEASISGGKIQQSRIDTEDTPLTSTSSIYSPPKLRSSSQSVPQGIVSEKTALSHSTRKTTERPKQEPRRKLPARKVLPSETADDQGLKDTTSESRTQATAFPSIPERHKLVHIVRHCRAWHK